MLSCSLVLRTIVLSNENKNDNGRKLERDLWLGLLLADEAQIENGSEPKAETKALLIVRSTSCG